MKPIRPVLGIAAFAILALFVIQQLRSDDPNLLTEAPAIPTATARASGST